MRLLAIDPGPEESGWVNADISEDPPFVFSKGIDENPRMMELIDLGLDRVDALAYEEIVSYGMPVSTSIFDTVFFSGRVVERFGLSRSFGITRREVKLFLCNSMQAKDKHVRQALLDRYPRSGGGSTPQVGIKDAQGPLYGVKGDIWAALGVALTFQDKLRRGEVKIPA